MNYSIVTRCAYDDKDYKIYINLDVVKQMCWDESIKKTSILFIDGSSSILVRETPEDILGKHVCNTTVPKVRVLNG